jgi:hypothetical protein
MSVGSLRPREPVLSSFPRSAWECSAEGGLCVLRGPNVGRTTRSVEDGIPTEDRGNERKPQLLQELEVDPHRRITIDWTIEEEPS